MTNDKGRKCDRISKAECARRLGCSKTWIAKLVKRGELQTDKSGKIIVTKRVNQVYSFSADSADRRLKLKERMQIAKTVQDECKAELLLKQVENTNSEIIELEQAILIARTSLEIVKDCLQPIPKKLGEVLQGKGARTIAAIMEEEIRGCLFEAVRKIGELMATEQDNN